MTKNGEEMARLREENARLHRDCDAYQNIIIDALRQLKEVKIILLDALDKDRIQDYVSVIEKGNRRHEPTN
jgi:hypothetical protein